MPATAVTPVTVSRGGVAVHAAAIPANVDATNGNTVSGNDGHLHILFRTGAATSDLKVTQVALDGATAAVKTLVTAQAANTEVLYGPFPTTVYGPTLLFTGGVATATIVPITVASA